MPPCLVRNELEPRSSGTGLLGQCGMNMSQGSHADVGECTYVIRFKRIQCILHSYCRKDLHGSDMDRCFPVSDLHDPTSLTTRAFKYLVSPYDPFPQ